MMDGLKGNGLGEVGRVVLSRVVAGVQVSAADKSVLSIDVLPQVGGRVREGVGLSLGEGLVDDGGDALLTDGELFDRLDLVVDDALAGSLDGIRGGSDAINLLSGAVRRSGVGHGVAHIAVGHHLEHDRACV